MNNCTLGESKITKFIETHNQLHFDRIVYSKWSIIYVTGIFRINNRKKIFISVIHRSSMYVKILNKNTRVSRLLKFSYFEHKLLLKQI